MSLLIRFIIAITWLLSACAIASQSDIKSSEELIRDDAQASSKVVTVSRMKNTGMQIELCSDSCALFTFPRKKDIALVWDLIFLFESLVSTDSTFANFREIHRPRAIGLLDELKKPTKFSEGAEQVQAICVLSGYSKKIGLEYAAVNYDEGYRCVAHARFSNLNTITKRTCTPYQSR